MTSPRNARIASKALEAATRVDPPAPSDDARAEAIAAIEKAIVDKARRRRTGRRLVVASAAAAALILGVGAMRYAPRAPRPPEVALAPGAPGAPAIVVHPSGPGDEGSWALSPGAHVRLPKTAGHATAVLAFSTGTSVKVEEGGDVMLVEQGASQVLALESGALRADVAKLAPGDRFVVRTADAEVEVHGTSFRVANAPSDPACGNGTTTRVVVYEGVVVVRATRGGAEERVAAGDSWPRGCAMGPAIAPAAAPVQVQAPTPTPPLTPTPAIPKAAAADAPPPTTLAAQNDMFAAAVAAKRRGDASGAIAGFDAFLTKYPASPLAENAAAQRMKLLADVDRPRAAEAARAYLARWPDGFAKSDAAALVRAGTVAGAPP